MANVIIRPDWHLPEKLVTPERDYRNRRQFIKEMGIVAGAGISAGVFAAEPTAAGNLKLYPGKRNPKHNLKVKLTDKAWATGYNNFYEFGTEKEDPARNAHTLNPKPWKLTIDGEVGKPGSYDLDDFIKPFTLEERVYRMRCVEGWSMVIPWYGFSLNKIINNYYKIQRNFGGI